MLNYLLDGGWMMLPLVLCSIISLAILIDRVRAFRVAGTASKSLCDEIRRRLADGGLDDAIQYCLHAGGPVAATLLVGLQRYRRMRENGRRTEEIEIAVSKTMEDYAPKALQGLERRLNLLVLVASVSPLLGMTGTVTGMIRSFDVMASSAGLDPGAVAGGISEALITTAAGLLIAIPAVVAYNLFSRRIEDFTLAIETGITILNESICDG